jgi:hypothetical protein
VAYLMQIDGDPPQTRLPFEPPLEPGSGGESGNSGTGGSNGTTTTTGQAGAGDTSTGAPPPEAAEDSGCACRMPGSSRGADDIGYALVALGLWGAAVSGRRSRGSRRWPRQGGFRR